MRGWVILRLGRREYALERRHVRALLCDPVLTRLPVTASKLPWCGLVQHHGTLVGVLDLRRWLRQAGESATRSGWAVVVAEPGQREVALWVDEVWELLAEQPDALEQPPAGAELVRATVRLGARTLLLLDGDRMVRDAAAGRAPAAGPGSG